MSGIRESSVEAACVEIAENDGWLEIKNAAAAGPSQSPGERVHR